MHFFKACQQICNNESELGSLCSFINKYSKTNRQSSITGEKVMVMWPMELGRSVMKSMALCDQGQCGAGNGCSSPAISCREDLEILQVGQSWMKVIVSKCKVGHQKRLERSWMVSVIPGWPELGEEWKHWMGCWINNPSDVKRLLKLPETRISVACPPPP